MLYFEISKRLCPIYWKNQKQLGTKDFPDVTPHTSDRVRTLEKGQRGTQKNNDENNRKKKKREADREKTLGSGQDRLTHRN